MPDVPEDLLYSDEHEWLLGEGDIGTVGITDYAQSELGDIVFVELPEVGIIVQQGEPFGTIEAVKTVADLYAPASGEVMEINESLEDDPGQVNADPYGAGWMVKIQIDDVDELEALLPPKEYEELIGDI